VPALLGAALAGVLLLGSSAGRGPLLLAVLVLQAVLALGAVAPVHVPSARPAALLALAAGAVGAVATWAADRGLDVTVQVAALGLSFVAAIVIQLARRDGRAQLTASLGLTASALVAVMLPVWWMALRGAPYGSVAVALGLAGAGAVLLAEGTPGRSRLVARRAVGVLLAGGTGAMLAATGWPAPATVAAGATVATAAGLGAVLAVAAVDRASADLAERGGPALARSSARTFPATLPLCLAAPVAAAAGDLLLR
jgi:hypothetical protein